MSDDRFTVNKLAWLEQVASDVELSLLSRVIAMIIGLRYLNRDTGDAWPGTETLAEDIGRGRTQVHEALGSLADRGHLEITTTSGGKGQTNRYRPILKGPNPSENRTKPFGNPNPSEKQTLRKSGTNPSENRTKPFGNPKGNPYEEPYEEPIEGECLSPPLSRPSKITDDAEFESFWRVYPRKEAKGAARRAFAKARKSVELDVLVAGATRYAGDRSHENPKYTKHPATWLNGECWADEPVQTRQEKGGFGPSGRRKTFAEQGVEIARRQMEQTDE